MVEELSPGEVADRLRSRPDSLFLLDVREPDEREIARIAPSAHVPMAEVPRRVRQLPRDRTIVVYCHHGSRSAMVAGYLEAVGFDRVANLSGGIDAWSAEVDPAVARYR